MTTPAEDAAFEAKAEKMLRGHRLPPNGRNVFAWNMRHLNNEAYRKGFQLKPPEGAYRDLDSRYCPKCDKLKVWCECRKN